MIKKYKLFIFIGLEVLAITAIFLLIFFAGRQTYTVTFDLNGGELISGNLEQEVRRGTSATAPNVAREGCYFLKWSHSYNKVTGNVVTYAVWEYETTEGIEYEFSQNSNYCLIKGCYENLSGDIYIGSYYDNKKVLGIKDGAFKNHKYLTGIYLLDGLISIGNNAFEGCEELKFVTIPKTVERIGAHAFLNCATLEKIEFSNEVVEIKQGAFIGCDSLLEVYIPETCLAVGEGVFDNENLVIKVAFKEGETPEGWHENWVLNSKEIIYEYTPENEEINKDLDNDKK